MVATISRDAIHKNKMIGNGFGNSATCGDIIVIPLLTRFQIENEKGTNSG